MEQQKGTRELWGLLSRFSRGSRGYFALALFCSTMATVLSSLTPQVIKITVDSVLGDLPFGLPAAFLPALERLGGREMLRGHLYLLGLLLVGIAVFSALFNYGSRVGIALGSEGFVRRLRNTLYEHIQKLPFSWNVSHQTGDIIQRCTSDVESVSRFLSNQVLEVFRTSFLIVFALCIMFSMNVKLSLVALAFIPITMAYTGIYYSKIAKKFRVTDAAEGELATVVQENLTGVRVVRAFGRERHELARFDEKNKKFSGLWISMGYTMGTYWGFGDLFTGLQIACIVILGAMETVHGAITLGEFLAFVSYNATLTWPIRSLGRIFSEMSKAGVSVERLNYILNAKEEEDAPGAGEPPMDRDITFDHVTFGYGEGQPVLKDISFTIPTGTTFAILGGTGSGKSTLMHLLNRLYDLPRGCGSIRVGDADLRDIRHSWLRKNVGMVLQEPFLFSRTIEENIAAVKPDASLEEIRAAAAIACVDEAITEFPLGYDTIVGERGVTLSGGQKQRVAIARMLMQNAPIMVFDDSLSAVDSETDSKIRAALKERVGGATTILISHRITTLMQADCILVLKDGAIAEMGSHQELLRRDGIYKSIYDIQMNQDDRILTEGGEDVGSL